MSVDEQTQEPARSFLTFSCVSVTVTFVVGLKVSFPKKKVITVSTQAVSSRKTSKGKAWKLT